MSFLKEKIDNDLKQAMRERNERTVSVLRMLNSAIKEREISFRKNGDSVVLSDDQIADVAFAEIKKRKDAASIYEKGGREDLFKKESEEIIVIEKYLPVQLSDEEIERIVREVAGSQESRDFGRLMGLAMSRVKGKADGNKVNEIVKSFLTEKSE